MSFLENLTAFLPVGKKEEKKEYFFAVNIGAEQLTAGLWTIAGKELKILDVASGYYSSDDEIITITDKLLDAVLGLKDIEPQKILFGVPGSWIVDDNLKDEYLKILRILVKELELAPMAYVATHNALVHFLDRQERVPTTAILVGFEKSHLTVTVVRAGKIDGVKTITRGENAGPDIEKILLAFTDIETLPSRILIYGQPAPELKSQLLSFSWMSKLSFLHFPKIDVLGDDIEIKSVCLAGASEINEHISYTDQPLKKTEETKENSLEHSEHSDNQHVGEPESQSLESLKKEDNFGFIAGDVTNNSTLAIPAESSLEIEDFGQDDLSSAPLEKGHKKKFSLAGIIPKNSAILAILFGMLAVSVLLAGAYLYFFKASVKVFVEPKVLEKDAEVIADPNQKTVNEEGKIIPGQIVDIEVSGSAKDAATGKRQIGDPAKGITVIRNKTDSAVTLSKGTIFTGNSQKFTLDVSVTIASRSADDGTWGKANATATAVSIGADGNISSGTDMTVSSYSTDKIIAKSEGNFSGGTSKDVTVVSNEDQQRLLAKLSSDLRKQAQQKLQDKYPDKKILEEALSENITKKSYNKNINDAASEFSLNMTVKFKGTAFGDADLKAIVSRLVNTQVPDGFTLDLAETETQADVSKLEKDGKLIFLARFKAKLIPKIDAGQIKSQIKFKTPTEVVNMLKAMDNVLGAEIKITPSLPKALQRLPILSKNITVEVGLK